MWSVISLPSAVVMGTNNHHDQTGIGLVKNRTKKLMTCNHQVSNAFVMPRGLSLHSNHKATCIFARPQPQGGRHNSDNIAKQLMSILGDSNIEDLIKSLKEVEETLSPLFPNFNIPEDRLRDIAKEVKSIVGGGEKTSTVKDDTAAGESNAGAEPINSSRLSKLEITVNFKYE